MQERSGKIKVNGVSIALRDSGLDKMPLIFIHGFPFDKSMWDPQFDALSPYARVIAYDLRGFGNSESGNEDLSMDLFADDLVGLMDSLNIQQAVICGLSMGGYISLNALKRYPGRLKGVVLCDTQCNADTPEGRKKRFDTIEQIEAKGLEEFGEGFIKNVFCKNSLENKKDIVDEIKRVVLANSPGSVQAALKALAERRDTCGILPTVELPALVICGKEDTLTPVEKSEYLASNIPGAQLRILDDAGHLSNLEQPGVFNRHLISYITSL